MKHERLFGEEEFLAITLNVTSLQSEVRLLYDQARDKSHHGRPSVIEVVYTGNTGRPSYRIDRDFLTWAYTVRSTAGIAHFLGVSRNVVHSALLDYGIAQLQVNPFVDRTEGQNTEDDNDFLDPAGPAMGAISSYTGPLLAINDEELDERVREL